MTASSSNVLDIAARFASSSAFPDAVRAYAVGIAKFREAPLLVNKLVATDVRWRIVGYLLYLDADHEVFGPEGGATYGRLLDICSRRREAGPTTLKTVLALLRLTGFVRAVRDSRDSRATLYRPTERMGGFVREWLGYGVAALERLEPDRGWARMFAEDGDFVHRFLVSGGRDHVGGRPIAELMPSPLADFTAQAGAFSVIWALWLVRDSDQPTPSRAAIGRRYGLSKTQVTNVIAVGRKRGLFALNPAGGAVPTEMLHAALQRWIAIELAYYAIHMLG